MGVVGADRRGNAGGGWQGVGGVVWVQGGWMGVGVGELVSGCVIGNLGVGCGVGGGDGWGHTTQKWPQKGDAKKGANAWVCLRCGSPTLATLQYKKSGAWGCVHHHVAPRDAHSVVLGI